MPSWDSDPIINLTKYSLLLIFINKNLLLLIWQQNTIDELMKELIDESMIKIKCMIEF